jgi:hypothetical protein
MNDTYEWRLSSYTGQGNSCVEVADNLPGTVAVRDSKDRQGPILAFTAEEWAVFTAAIKAGRVRLR